MHHRPLLYQIKPASLTLMIWRCHLPHELSLFHFLFFFFSLSLFSCFLVACCSKEPLLNTWPLCNGGRVALAEGPRLTAGLGEVLQASLGVSLHGVAARLPAGGANLAVLVGELERLDQAQGLVDVAADGQVVDGDLAQGALGVDDEEAAQGDALLLNEAAVVAGNLEVLVGNQGQLEVLAQTTLLAGALAPRQVGEVAVGGDTQHGGVELLELGQGVVVGENLGGADKGEVHGVEQEDDPGVYWLLVSNLQSTLLVAPFPKLDLHLIWGSWIEV